jgi:hypothetical protein
VLLTLVDSLRCPAHDEESSLVLSVEGWAGPRIAEGVLGCPLCHARYRIHRGAVEFVPSPNIVRRSAPPPDPVRLAAQLALTEPGGLILLTGRYAAVHEELAMLAEATFVLLDSEVTSAPQAVTFFVSDRLPFVDGALRGAALDFDGSRLLPEVERSVRLGGRIVVPRPAAQLSNAQLVAEDDVEWVGELLPRPIQLKKVRRN